MVMRPIARILVALAVFASLILAAPIGPSSAATTTNDSDVTGLVIVRSNNDFEATWQSVVDTVEANPNLRLIAQVDHAAAAARVGLQLEPNRVAVFGNPRLGSPVMAAGRTAGLDLPQKMQVFEENGEVYLAYNSVQYLGSRHWTDPLPQYATIHAALKGIATKATGNTPDADNINVVRTVGQVTGRITVTSSKNFDETWADLLAAIEGSPASVAFTVDHGANSNGLLAPTRLVAFGNPNLGTPFMQDQPSAGLDLPLKILVWQDDDGSTKVSTNNIAFFTTRHGIGELPQATAATNAVQNFVNAATS